MKRILVLLAAIVAFASFQAVVVLAQAVGRGELVLVRSPQRTFFVKVAVAVPGDTVSISGGRLLVNGVLEGSVLQGTPNWGPRRLAESEYFVVGDPLTLDAEPTAWGIVSVEDVLGVVQRRN